MTKISALQMTSSSKLEENLAKVALLTQKAADQGSKLIVLPEMFPISGFDSTAKLKISEQFGSGPIQDFLSTLAKKHQIWIVGGTIPISVADPTKVRAACLVFDDQGKVVGRYDKMHLFDVVISESETYLESATTEAGTALTLIDTPFGKLGLSVCYDIRFPELFRRLFNSGAEIFAIPAAFTVKTGQAHWEILARSRAIENFCYVIGACQTGTHDSGRKTYGHSLILNPWGEVMQSLPEGEGVITADIDLNLLRDIRKNIPIEMHQRIFFADNN